ncbi:hypothetical protein D3C77_410640 [compost metagenome]
MPGQTSGRITDTTDHRTELALEHAQGKINLADAIAAPAVQLLTEWVVSDRHSLGTQALKRLEDSQDNQGAEATGQQYFQHTLPRHHRRQQPAERRHQHQANGHPGPQLPAQPEHRQALPPGLSTAAQLRITALGSFDLLGSGLGSD